MKSTVLAITVTPRSFDIHRAAEVTRIHPDLIVEFERGHLVSRCATDQQGDPVFNESGISRLNFISDLRTREHLSLRMMRMVCHMMDRIDRAETEVKFLRSCSAGSGRSGYGAPPGPRGSMEPHSASH